MSATDPHDLPLLMKQIGYNFAQESLLRDALTHPSTKTRKSKACAYERLEFLGDRVLGLVIAHWLYELYPDADEGAMAKRHAALVNRDALKKVGLELGLGQQIALAAGEKANEARKNLAAISDATEGIIGALYLDGGLAVAERFIKHYWESEIRAEHAPTDPKTVLQEYVQGRQKPLPVYREVGRSGPAHAPHFVIEVSIKGHDPVQAEGPSKREAEKLAALRLLQEIGAL